MTDFSLYNLEETLLDNLNSMNYHSPTPIQSQTIPLAIAGKDILATAQTGTGKTGAYGVAGLNHLFNNPKSAIMVLTPTRELAIQVIKLLEQMLGKRSSIKTALLIGGDPISKQLNQLEQKPRLIVGTPGRIYDHIERKSLNLNNINFLVLDETDRMLDMGFEIQLEQIVKFIPKQRQTLMFSATLPSNIQRIAAKYLIDASRISIGSHIAAADTIEQEIIKTSEAEKHDILLQQLDIHNGSFIIFVKTKIATEKLALKLREHGHSADAIHGDLRQRNREKVIKSFRNKKYRILVATDVAARGLDIPHIEQVVNFDLPQCEEDFIHRIGRTGRAGKSGKAISLITPQDHIKWFNICKMMNPGQKIEPLFEDRFKQQREERKSRRGSRFSRDSSRSRNFNDNSPKRSDSRGKSATEPSNRSFAGDKDFRSRPLRESSSESGISFNRERDFRKKSFRDGQSETKPTFGRERDRDSRKKSFRDGQSETKLTFGKERDRDSRKKSFRDSSSEAGRKFDSEKDFRSKSSGFRSDNKNNEREGFGKRKSSDFRSKNNDKRGNSTRSLNRGEEQSSNKPKRRFFI